MDQNPDQSYQYPAFWGLAYIFRNQQNSMPPILQPKACPHHTRYEIWLIWLYFFLCTCFAGVPYAGATKPCCSCHRSAPEKVAHSLHCFNGHNFIGELRLGSDYHMNDTNTLNPICGIATVLPPGLLRVLTDIKWSAWEIYHVDLFRWNLQICFHDDAMYL